MCADRHILHDLYRFSRKNLFLIRLCTTYGSEEGVGFNWMDLIRPMVINQNHLLPFSGQ